MKEHDLATTIIRKNGSEHQVAVAMGELGELTAELAKTLRGKPDFKHLCEEMADVEICLYQMKKLFDPDNKFVPFYKRFKLKRLELFYINGDDK